MADISNQISRLEKSIDRLADSINKGGGFRGGGNSFEDIEESANKAADAIDRITKSITRDINNLARQLPIIGDLMAKNIDKATRSLVSGIAGGTSVGGKVGLAAIAAAAAAVGNEFVKISKAQADLAKQTGLYGNQLTNIRQITTSVYQSNIKYGVSMSDAANSAAALTTALGSTSRVTTNLVTLNATLAKYAGTSAEAMSGLTSTLVRGFSMSSKEAENFTNIIANRAVAAGQNAALIIRDMATNSNLVAMHSQRGADYIAEMAKYSGAMGVSFEKMQKMSDIFINMETGAEMAQKINMWTGSTLNSQLLFNKALKGDTLGIFKDLNAAFSTPKGISMITKYPGAARQLAQQLGLSYNELRKIAMDGPQSLKRMASQKEEQLAIKDALREQYTFYEKIQYGLGQVIIPILSKAGEMVYGMAKSLENMGFEGATSGLLTSIGVMSGAFAAGTIYKMLMKGATPQTATWVKIAPGAGPGFPIMGGTNPPTTGGGRSGPGRQPPKFLTGKTGMAIGGASLLAGTAGLSMGGMDGFDTVLSLISLIAPFFPPYGPVIGAAAGGIGLLKNMFFDKAATGRVVSSPSLFMVGEENRKEIIIPTERIRKGLPVSADVASELSSIGVPGFARGALVTTQNQRLQYATQGGQAAYSGAASLAETRRRQQEMTAVNREYQRKLDAQHDEVTDLMKEQLRQERVLNSLTLGAINSPRGGGGMGTFSDFLKDLLEDFKESAMSGVRQGYNIWKASLTENQRKWVETGEATIDFIKTYRDEGKKVALTQLMINQKWMNSMDFALGKAVGHEGLGQDIGGGLRDYLYYNQVVGLSQKRSLAMGGGQLFSSMSQRLQRGEQTGIGFFDQFINGSYWDRQNTQNKIGLSGAGLSQQTSYDTSQWQLGSQIGSFQPQYATGQNNPTSGMGLMTPKWSGFGSDQDLSTNQNRNYTPVTLSEIPSPPPSPPPPKMTDGQRTARNAAVAQAGLTVGMETLGAGLDIYGKYGWSRQGARAALGAEGLGRVGGATSSAGASLLAASPAAGPAAPALATAGAIMMGVGTVMQIGSLFLPNAVGDSKSEARVKALNDLQKLAGGKRDIGLFDKEEKLRRATKGKSSQTRTLTSLMMMFSNRGLKMGEAMKLLKFLVMPKSFRQKSADRFYWNQRLFGVTAEEQELMDARTETDSLGTYREMYGDKSFDTVQEEFMAKDRDIEGRSEDDYYRELLRRVNKEHGTALKIENFKKDGIINEAELFDAVQATGFDVQSYAVNAPTDNSAPPTPGEAGPGGTMQLPPEFMQTMNQLNYNIQQMSQEQTIQILVDGQRLAEAVVNGGNR